jgi:hypothetical protein
MKYVENKSCILCIYIKCVFAYQNFVHSHITLIKAFVSNSQFNSLIGSYYYFFSNPHYFLDSVINLHRDTRDAVHVESFNLTRGPSNVGTQH